MIVRRPRTFKVGMGEIKPGDGLLELKQGALALKQMRLERRRVLAQPIAPLIQPGEAHPPEIAPKPAPQARSSA